MCVFGIVCVFFSNIWNENSSMRMDCPAFRLAFCLAFIYSKLFVCFVHLFICSCICSNFYLNSLVFWVLFLCFRKYQLMCLLLRWFVIYGLVSINFLLLYFFSFLYFFLSTFSFVCRVFFFSSSLIKQSEIILSNAYVHIYNSWWKLVIRIEPD